MIKAKYTEIIDEYLEGSLSDSERDDFENALHTDKDIEQEFELHKDLDRILSDQKVVDFRSTLMDAQQEYKRSQKRVPKIVKMARKYRYAAASVVLLLMIVGSILVISPRSYSNEQLFHKYYKPGDAVGITRSGNVNVVDAIMKFHNGDYRAACDLFGDILKLDPSNVALMYYYGIASIEIQEYDLAAEMFNKIINNGNNLYIEYAQWYLGLTYLVKGENDNAISRIDAIVADPQHHYHKDAAELSERLKKSIKK